MNDLKTAQEMRYSLDKYRYQAEVERLTQELDVLMRQLNVLLHDMLWNPNVTSVGWAKRVKAMIDEARNTTQSAEEEYLDIPAFERRRNPPKVDSHPAFTNPHTANEVCDPAHHTESPAHTGADNEQDFHR